jgi:hypothetical protein
MKGNVMKYYSRLKVYKASNVQFSVESKIATSYGWWEFVKPINGKLVFNSYNYSSTTIKHQRKISRVLSELGLQTIRVDSPQGLQDLDSAIKYNFRKVTEIKIKLESTRIHADTRRWLKRDLIVHLKAIKFLRAAGVTLNHSKQAEIKESVLSEIESDKQRKKQAREQAKMYARTTSFSNGMHMPSNVLPLRA